MKLITLVFLLGLTTFGLMTQSLAQANSEQPDLSLEDPDLTVQNSEPNISNPEPSALNLEQRLENSDSNLVEVESPEVLGDVSVERHVTMSSPYKERRGRHGVLFGFGTEKYYPTNLYSLLDDVHIDEILGRSAIDLFGFELGYKYNFNLGSLALTYGYAAGTKTGTYAGSSRSMDITRQNISLAYLADNILKEPWVVPYGQVGIHQFSLDEEEFTSSGTISTTVAEDASVTGFALNYKLGILFQLDWIESGIDSTTRTEGLRSSGLENTYLDIGFTYYQPSQELFDPDDAVGTASFDPDMSAEEQFSIGLKLEF